MKIFSKFNSVNKWMRLLFFLALANVLLDELLLKRFESPNQTTVALGEILLRLSYSYVAGFIFFFIATYLEKDRKKISIFWMTYEKTVRINTEIGDIFNSLFAAAGLYSNYNEQTSFHELQKNLDSIDTTKPIISIHHNIQFTDVYELLYYKKQLLKELITDLYHFADYLDSDYLNYLANIDSKLMDINVFNYNKRLGVLNLRFAENTFQMLHDYSWDLQNRFDKISGRLKNEYNEKAKQYRKNKGWDK